MRRPPVEATIGGMEAIQIRELAVRSVRMMADGSREEFHDVLHREFLNHEAKDEPPGSRGRGPEAAYATALWLRDAFAELSWEIHEVVVEGDLAVVHCTMSGRHVRPFAEYDEEARIREVFPPTGRRFASTQTHWLRVADGRVIEHWANRDDLGTAFQLGWVPPTPLYLLRSALAKRRARKRAPSALKAAVLVVGFAAVALGAAQGAEAGIALNTIDRQVTYDRDGARVRSAGPIGCTRGERIAIAVRVRQAATGARARGRWKGRCTGEAQRWRVRASAGESRFASGRGRVCAVARTRAGGNVSDVRRWCRRVSVSPRSARASSRTTGERMTPEGVPVPELDWRPCHDGFECASAAVPRDYRRPHGAKVRLGLVRHPAVDPERRIGTLFFNPGGPGAVAAEIVDRVPSSMYQALPRFDVVAFEQRGVGASEPAIDCDELPHRFSPMTPESFDLRELLRRGRRLAELCLNRDREFLAGLNTGNLARDLDVLRAAVGDEHLSYLGVSYGGMIGETYASLFPGRARALVLDSPVDADVWLNRPLDAITEQNVSFEASLDRFFAACAANQATCRFGGDDPERAYDDLLARLDADPLPAGEGRTIDGRQLSEVTHEALYSKRFWRPLAAALSVLEGGDPSALLALGSELTAGDDLLLDVYESYTSVELRYPRRIQRYLDFAEHQFAVAPHFATDYLGAFEEVRHLYWPVKARGAFYGPFRNPPSAAPVLVLHTTHDPATPYAWGRRVVRQLGNARLLTVRGDGHGILTQFNQCALGAAIPYIDHGALPPKGATCEQDIPFADSPAPATRRQRARAR
jgi:pimeloyl-ACP methyl ester carboxylesterase/predicted ester cyclase